MRAGAFVELFGLAGRVEGMVHISNLSSRRVSDVTEVCQRGQEVWVKVLSIQDPKPGQTKARIELSMRDVDQSTGTDLLPLHAPSGGGMGALPAAASSTRRQALSVGCLCWPAALPAFTGFMHAGGGYS